MDNIGAIFWPSLVGAVVLGALVWVVRPILPTRQRFIIDERGERQRVEHWNRGEPVYTPKTWQQRIDEEARLRSKRRRELLVSVLFVVGPIWLAYEAFGTDYTVLKIGAGFLLVCVALPIALMMFLPALVAEITYQSGYQGMEGAKVLDPKPDPEAGRELVEGQMAHGSARAASESEALSLLKSKK